MLLNVILIDDLIFAVLKRRLTKKACQINLKTLSFRDEDEEDIE